jgi:hypothetical protein
MTYPAIVTRYLGPTERRGGRVVAVFGEHRRTVPYDHAAPTVLDAHRIAALRVLADASDGMTYRVTGTGYTARGYVFTVEPDGGGNR